MASLIADRERLSIETTGMMVTPGLALNRNDVTEVRSVRGLFSKGLRFESTDARLKRIIIWTPPFGHGRVLAALSGLGWPVNDRSAFAYRRKRG